MHEIPAVGEKPGPRHYILVDEAIQFVNLIGRTVDKGTDKEFTFDKQFAIDQIRGNYTMDDAIARELMEEQRIAVGELKRLVEIHRLELSEDLKSFKDSFPVIGLIKQINKLAFINIIFILMVVACLIFLLLRNH